MYSTKIDGQVLEFGTSGLLYRSNKLMYDRGTETLWRQFTGEPVVGSLVGSGIKLEVLPVLLTTWGDWLATHPDTTVLDPDTGYYPVDLYSPEWDSQSIYYSLRQQPETSFPVWDKSGRLPEKSEVFGLIVGGRGVEVQLSPRRKLQVGQFPRIVDSSRVAFDRRRTQRAVFDRLDSLGAGVQHQLRFRLVTAVGPGKAEHDITHG